MIYLYHERVNDIWFAVAVEDTMVVAVSFSPKEERALRLLLKNLPYDKPFQAAKEPTPFFIRLVKSLKAIFNGEGASSKFKLAMGHLPNYTQRVLKCVSQVPLGYVATYGAIADVVGGSPRSVGRAVAVNPFPLLVPCHRVVKVLRRNVLTVGGYGLDVETKLEILRREDKGHRTPTKVKVGDKNLFLYPVGFVRELSQIPK